MVAVPRDSLTEAGLDETGSTAIAGADVGPGADDDAGFGAEVGEAGPGALAGAAAGVCGSISSTAEEKRTAAAGAS